MARNCFLLLGAGAWAGLGWDGVGWDELKCQNELENTLNTISLEKTNIMFFVTEII